MRVHHLNCGTMCPFGGRLFDGITPGLGGAKLSCHCLLVETDNQLVLIDTGFGMGDVDAPHERLSEFFYFVDRPKIPAEETAIRQVERLGYSPADVRHIVLTHLDFDHAGGLSDFPHATVHLHAQELTAARERSGIIARGRYRPKQWGEATHWQTYNPNGESWFGFQAVRDLRGMPPEILLVPLPGHTRGHCGVAVQENGRWLLNAGDAYFYRDEMLANPRCTPMLAFYERMMEVDRSGRLHNQQRLREMVNLHADEVRVFCSHDWVELETAQQWETVRTA